MLCNKVQREGSKLRTELAFGLFCYMLLHNIRDGIRKDAIPNVV